MSDHTPFFPKNLEDYAPWVFTHGLTAPYGQCQCGCGSTTAISEDNATAAKWKAGHPKRYISGHNSYGPPLSVRLWKGVKVGDPNECWEWTGCTNPAGYGVIRVERVSKLAHRVAYELEHGKIEGGLNCLHRCDNPRCCNPHHLFLGTQQENIKDMLGKGRNAVGSGRKNAILTEDDVIAIRRLCGDGELQKDVAIQYGVNPRIISSIVMRRTWKHVP